MIHYINGTPAKNIKMNKTKRHALAHYRHTERMATIKDLAARVAIVAVAVAILTDILLAATN